MCQNHCSIDKVAINSHQFAIVSRLEIFPSKVIVFCFGCICTEDILQHILLSREVFEVFVQPHRPISRRRDFIALQIQELVCRNVVRQNVTALCLQHCRENDAVKDYVVLADKVNQFGVLVFPPFFPIAWNEFFGKGDISYGSIEPHIEDFSLCIGQRHFYSPIQVSCYRTRLQALVNPALALTINVGFPLFVSFQNPLSHKLFVLFQRQVPVFGFSKLGFCSRKCRFGIDKVGCGK